MISDSRLVEENVFVFNQHLAHQQLMKTFPFFDYLQRNLTVDPPLILKLCFSDVLLAYGLVFKSSSDLLIINKKVTVLECVCVANATVTTVTSNTNNYCSSTS